MSTSTEQRLAVERERADRYEAMLKDLHKQIDEKERHQRQAVLEAAEHQRKVEQERQYQEQLEESRKASWLRWHTKDGANISRLAANHFSPTWLKDNTPETGWPDDDGPENYKYLDRRVDMESIEAVAGDSTLVQEAKRLRIGRFKH